MGPRFADRTTWIEVGTAGRIKTTARPAAMVESLTQMGVQIDEQADSLVIDGGYSELRGATVDGQRDHRIITALSVLALVADGETTIIDAKHAETGFPGFSIKSSPSVRMSTGERDAYPLSIWVWPSRNSWVQPI